MSDKTRFINRYTDEFNDYQKSLLSHRDMVNAMKTKFEEGVEQGIENVTIRCLKQGKGVEEVCLITGLSAKQIEQIKNKIDWI